MNPTVTSHENAVFRLRSLYGSYGYAQFRMSRFEEYDLYMQNKSFLVSDQVITFTDSDGKLMALKPDVTLSIVKSSKATPGSVRKVWYDENVYRVAPGTRTFKEIRQLGLECLGDLDAYCISEVLSLAVRSLCSLSPDSTLTVSHLGILSAVLDGLHISPAGRAQLLTCVREKNLHDARTVCASEGADETAAAVLYGLMNCEGAPANAVATLTALLAGTDALPLLDGFAAILATLPADRVRVDFSVINDMNYYNGIVFQGFIRGIPTEILSGGQYDLLMKKMGKNAGAIGFAVYLDQLVALLPQTDRYDADVLLLYGDDVPLGRVAETVRGLTEAGQSVTALRTVPQGLRVRQTVKLTAKGVVQDDAE